MAEIHRKFIELVKDNSVPLTKDDYLSGFAIMSGINKMFDVLSKPKNQRTKHDELLVNTIRYFHETMNNAYIGDVTDEKVMSLTFKKEALRFDEWTSEYRKLHDGKSRSKIVEKQGLGFLELLMMRSMMNDMSGLFSESKKNNCFCPFCIEKREIEEKKSSSSNEDGISFTEFLGRRARELSNPSTSNGGSVNFSNFLKEILKSEKTEKTEDNYRVVSITIDGSEDSETIRSIIERGECGKCPKCKAKEDVKPTESTSTTSTTEKKDDPRRFKVSKIKISDNSNVAKTEVEAEVKSDEENAD